MAPFGKEPAPAPAPPTRPTNLTVLGRETRFAGDLTGTRGVRIEGHFKGSVDLKAPLEISEGAEVEAEVHATTIRVAGTVNGNLVASELVELLASAVVRGDVTTPSLHVVEGARLEGRIEMKTEPRGVAANSTASPQKPVRNS